MRITKLVRLAILLGAGALIGAGCAAGDTTAPDDSTPTTDAATSTSAAATSTTDAAATTTVATTTTTTPPTVGEPQTDAYTSPGFPGSGEPAFLNQVRTESYPGFSRIVFEFNDTVPEYQIEYIDGPVLARPSGNEVDIAGDAFLEIVMAPASGVDLSGDEPDVIYDGLERIAIDAGAITEIVAIEDHESHLSWVVGMAQTLPFSFSTLEEPSRLVIDIHPGGTS